MLGRKAFPSVIQVKNPPPPGPSEPFDTEHLLIDLKERSYQGITLSLFYGEPRLYWIMILSALPLVFSGRDGLPWRLACEPC